MHFQYTVLAKSFCELDFQLKKKIMLHNNVNEVNGLKQGFTAPIVESSYVVNFRIIVLCVFKIPLYGVFFAWLLLISSKVIANNTKQFMLNAEEETSNVYGHFCLASLLQYGK